jgi:ketosteroid isomerase-like protein
MKRILVFALLILTCPALTYCQAGKERSSARASAGVSPSVENEIREAIRQRLDAVYRGDAKAYVTYFGDDCIITGDNGALVKPEAIVKEWVDDLHSGATFKASDLMDFQVHSYGAIAVATFRIDLDQDREGQKLFESSRFTDAFARRGGRWLLVVHHETPIPNARRVVAKVDPAVFDAYAGEYQLPLNQIVKIKREGDKLMEQWPGATEYSEEMPVSESTFVARGELGEVIYAKDETGKVSHFIVRTGGGDLIAKKIK